MGDDSSSSSSGGGDDAGPRCTLYASDADLTMPTVSFKNDVMPIFEFSCGISSSCHGGDPAQDIMTRGLFLGCSPGSLEAGTCQAVGDFVPMVYADIAGPTPKQPLEIHGMPFITANDWTKSYLMHKMDGDQCTLTGCVANNNAVTAANETVPSAMSPNWCGQFMPLNVALLPAGPACGGSTDCVMDPAKYVRDTVRLWIQQGAMNN
jgi:hypothetical protein